MGRREILFRLTGAALAATALAATGCATAPSPASDPTGPTPRFTETVVAERWFAIPTRCGQGPYDLELDTVGGRWSEEVSLLVSGPRRMRLTAVLFVDGRELRNDTKTVGSPNEGSDPENQRCVASAAELAQALGRQPGAPARAPSSPGGSPPAHAADTPGADLPTNPGLALVPTTAPAGRVWRMVGKQWGTQGEPGDLRPAGRRIRIRIWSNVPNDFEGAAIGFKQVVVRPDMTDADYDAWVVERDRRAREAAARREAARTPQEIAAERERAEREQREAAERAAREQREGAERAAREQREAAERAAREQREAAARKAYCDAHLNDASCWGAGGLAVRQDLERRRAEGTAYCAAHGDEARCWNASEWSRRRAAWAGREPTPEPVREPTGPPPPARAEATTPRPSTNADWRPGYWHWAGRDWIWIAGLWRVPEEDIRAEQTTHAPVAPPAPQPEPPPPSPAPVAVWTPGFWQWSGSAWLWVPGSWQLRPAPGAIWRPAQWANRRGMFVLIPGGWISAAPR